MKHKGFNVTFRKFKQGNYYPVIRDNNAPYDYFVEKIEIKISSSTGSKSVILIGESKKEAEKKAKDYIDKYLSLDSSMKFSEKKKEEAALLKEKDELNTFILSLSDRLRNVESALSKVSHELKEHKTARRLRSKAKK
jgi:predicted nuclease with TOPRIM domain